MPEAAKKETETETFDMGEISSSLSDTPSKKEKTPPDAEQERDEASPSKKREPKFDPEELRKSIVQDVIAVLDSKSKKKDSDPSEDDASAEFFANPTKYLKGFSEELKKQIIKEVEGKYKEDQRVQRFWKTFEKENSDLRGQEFKEIAQTIVQRELPRWNKEGYTEDEVLSELADLTRKKVKRLLGSKEARLDPTETVEGSGPSPRQGQTQRKEVKEEKPPSLSDLIKSRRLRKVHGVKEP